MISPMSRRRVAALAGTLLAIPALAAPAIVAHADRDALQASIADLERKHGGRIGVSVRNLASGERIAHRADERFLMCSTFKALAAALVLSRVDRSAERLDRRVVFAKRDVVPYSPVTEPNVGGAGMTVAELCQAALTQSDNTAANLVLASFGGPPALTAFARKLGDDITRLDRIEPELNDHDDPADVRDTTTPAAMLETLQKLMFGTALSRSSRAQLAGWMVMNKTGDTRLRAGFPEDWTIADKTGGNGNKQGNNNDIAVAWPPNRGAVVVTAYCEIPSISAEQRNAVLAELGRIAAQV